MADSGIGPGRIVNDDGVRLPRSKRAALVGRFDVVDVFEAVVTVYFHSI